MQSRHFKSRFDLEDHVPVSAVTLTRLGKQFQITEPCFFPCVQRAGRLTLLRIRPGYQNISHSSIFWTLALALSKQIPRGQLESLRWTDVLLPHLVFCSVLSAPRGHKYFSHINVSRALFSNKWPRTQWFKRTEFDYPKVPELRGSTPQCLWAKLKLPKGLFSLLEAKGECLLAFAPHWRTGRTGSFFCL